MIAPTIGVMARAPLPGFCKSRLARALGNSCAADLYRAMLLDTLDAYSKLPFHRRILLAAPENDGVAVLRKLAPEGWSVEEQVGPTLGTRLAHARASLGNGPLVLASSDSPTAPLEPLRATLADWEDPKRVLLGPCYDGGYYLIGLARVEVHVFDGIAWSTREVLAQTRARCRALGLSVHELPTTYDVDEPVDLEQLRAELGLHPERAPRTAVALNL